MKEEGSQEALRRFRPVRLRAADSGGYLPASVTINGFNKIWCLEQYLGSPWWFLTVSKRFYLKSAQIRLVPNSTQIRPRDRGITMEIHGIHHCSIQQIREACRCTLAVGPHSRTDVATFSPGDEICTMRPLTSYIVMRYHACNWSTRANS